MTQIQPEFSPSDPNVRTVDVPLIAAGGRIVVQVYSTPGSQYVGTIVKALPVHGEYPDYQLWNLYTVQEARDLATWIRSRAMRALREDGVPDGQAMPIRQYFLDRMFQVLVASRDELQSIARALQSFADVADQRP